MTRRDFARTSTAALISSVASPDLLRAAAADAAPVVDTHLHCFAGKDDARFPYHERGPYRPEKAATPEHLLQCMDGAGVDFAVVVHPEPYQDDHRYLEHCLAVGKERLKGTCLFFADKPGATAAMAALKKQLGDRLVAARIHAYAPDRLPPFGKPELRAFWKSAADLGLAVQLHFEPRHATGFEPLIEEFKSTRVILDHLGRPMQATPEEHGRVVRWSRFPNTVMKISSLPEPTQYPHRDVRPIVRQLADAFGADRLIYGGGFSHDATPASYRAYREKVRALLAPMNAGDVAKVLGGTAAKLFGFPAKAAR
jgi:predicted TIM-barrel fold metal-dependent hydrolase